MTNRDKLLSASRLASAEPVMLISGLVYWIELPSVAGLLSRGVLPMALRSLALRFASDEGVVKADLDPEETERWDLLERVMICDAVRAIEWTCSCAKCVERRGPDPVPRETVRITPEELDAESRVISETEFEQLQQLVIRARSPRQVDAMSRMAHGEMTPEEAAEIIEAERVNTLAGWTSFRDLGRRAAGGDAGADVARPPVQPRDHLGPGARVRRRRRADAPAARGAAQPQAGG